MTIGRLENSIYAAYMVTPDRVIVPEPKPFDAPPGVVPFHRALESANLAHQDRVIIPAPAKIQRGVDVYTPSDEMMNRSADAPNPVTSGHCSAGSGLLPKLGEILPVQSPAPTQIRVQQTHQVQIPATGRVLDLYI